MSRNAILPDGTVAGLNLATGEQLVVRNYHGGSIQGLGPIPITVQDQITMADRGVLQMRFDADAWESLISFQPGISVTLGGTLELDFVDGVDIAQQIGRMIDVFDWTGVSPTGQFQVVSPYAWDLSHLYSTGEITLISSTSGLPGDINLDGTVNRLDAALFSRHFGLSAGSTWSTGDFDTDGATTLADLAILQANFGQPGASPAAPLSAAVPEPSTILLAVCGMVGVAVCRVRRRTVR